MPEVALAAPFTLFGATITPEWIDSNGHMNLAYYVLLFDRAVDVLFDAVGFGAAYRLSANCGAFAVETHTLYERELLRGEEVRVQCHVLAADSKRLHVAQEMLRLGDDARAAMQEALYLHVDLAARHVVPFPPNLKHRLDAAVAAHAALPRPDWIGRRVAMQR